MLSPHFPRLKLTLSKCSPQFQSRPHTPVPVHNKGIRYLVRMVAYLGPQSNRPRTFQFLVLFRKTREDSPTTGLAFLFQEVLL